LNEEVDIKIFHPSKFQATLGRMPLSDSLTTDDIPSSDGLQPPQSNPQQNTIQPNPMAVIRPRNQNQRPHTETITIEPENIQPAPQQIQARAVSTTSYTSEESEESLPDSFGYRFD
jgi:hypothetical protein